MRCSPLFILEGHMLRHGGWSSEQILIQRRCGQCVKWQRDQQKINANVGKLAMSSHDATHEGNSRAINC